MRFGAACDFMLSYCLVRRRAVVTSKTPWRYISASGRVFTADSHNSSLICNPQVQFGAMKKLNVEVQKWIEEWTRSIFDRQVDRSPWSNTHLQLNINCLPSEKSIWWWRITRVIQACKSHQFDRILSPVFLSTLRAVSCKLSCPTEDCSLPNIFASR